MTTTMKIAGVQTIAGEMIPDLGNPHIETRRFRRTSAAVTDASGKEQTVFAAGMCTLWSADVEEVVAIALSAEAFGDLSVLETWS